MKETHPTHEQMCKIIGSIYSDAFLRIESLENENKLLRETYEKRVDSLRTSLESLREENNRLKHSESKTWNNGKENSMLPESLRAKVESASPKQSCISNPQQDSKNLTLPKSTEALVETQNSTGR